MTRGLAVASLVAVVMGAPACVTKATDPTPTPTPTPGPPRSWSGTVNTRSSILDLAFPEYPPYVTTVTGTVTWERNPSPPAGGLTDATSYAVTGGDFTLTASGAPCGFEGAGHFSVAPWQPGAEHPHANTLAVRADGYYVIWLQQEVAFVATVSDRCPGPRTVELHGELYMQFAGNLNGGHVQGTTTEADSRSTVTASWDFAPRW